MRTLTNTLFALLPVFFLLIAPAHAERNFPPNVKPAELRGVEYPYVRIDDRTFRLAPGGRIYDTFNRIVLPNAAPKSGKVLFKLDPQGLVIKLWILTPEEIARLSQ
ncbi:MAG: hypothetical protein HZA59_00190 [Hydrogenophilales bacterium]|nr:hypothetical protein [Hydrogenophilales bacterium]